MLYARIQDGAVVEVIELPDNVTLADAFHPDIAVLFLQCPDDVSVDWLFKDGEWFPPHEDAIDLDQLKADRVAALTRDCAAAIVGGYVSEALGTLHTYPSGVTDQINMMGSVTGSLLPDLAAGWETPFWCANKAGAWGWRMHNASQIQRAGSDGKAHVVTCQTTLATLNAQVEAAKTVAAVNAIDWPT
ncbi:hypothetical protein GGQ73_003168 [Rhizobium skierniewicense]|uniref:DUF4376 domain-containing protein n=1 Tax=Rhizobium skierniewicense TaxID=984260 RepID=A0A7W6C7K0_9HYPH|nr:hypothetical protein [Rhizobium skierniewicense]MBB3947202.1 hypothetical protein [Rhizobium skierniewicense]